VEGKREGERTKGRDMEICGKEKGNDNFLMALLAIKLCVL
jgi:hypothetical protein